MPGRLIPLVSGEYYHIYNRGINKQPIFLEIRDYKRALQLVEFYSFAGPQFKYSKFLRLSTDERERVLNKLRSENKKLVKIICYTFMPNHFHFLLKQVKDGGISKFVGNFQNSYTRYFNVKHNKIGPLLQGQFKSVHIEDNTQLLHLTRYIHLNPFTSYVVKEISGLVNYPWSSYSEYVGESTNNVCNKEIILSQFTDQKNYQSFVMDRASYQRELDRIKHLVMEEI